MRRPTPGSSSCSRTDPDASLTVDLAEGGILLPDGSTIDFEIDPFAKRMLLAGTDELGYLLSKDAELRAWEAAHPPRIDSLAGALTIGAPSWPRCRPARPAEPTAAASPRIDGDITDHGQRGTPGPLRSSAAHADPRRPAGPLALVLLVTACAGTAGHRQRRSRAARPRRSGAVAERRSAGDRRSERAGGHRRPARRSAAAATARWSSRKPGQLDPRPVTIEELKADVDGRHVLVTATWTSGVEPCYVLDRIVVEKGADSFTITLFEGRGPGDPICIEIAQTKQTQVDLGELEPGTYTIADGQGGAAPIEVTVS